MENCTVAGKQHSTVSWDRGLKVSYTIKMYLFAKCGFFMLVISATQKAEIGGLCFQI